MLLFLFSSCTPTRIMHVTALWQICSRAKTVNWPNVKDFQIFVCWEVGGCRYFHLTFIDRHKRTKDSCNTGVSFFFTYKSNVGIKWSDAETSFIHGTWKLPFQNSDWNMSICGSCSKAGSSIIQYTSTGIHLQTYRYCKRFSPFQKQSASNAQTERCTSNDFRVLNDMCGIHMMTLDLAYSTRENPGANGTHSVQWWCQIWNMWFHTTQK